MSSDDSIVYLNGQFGPLSDAKISVLDRGFLFGDAVYEVIPIFFGKPLRLDEHLDRLENSLAEIRMQSPLTHQQWRSIIERLICGTEDQSIYLQITRGVMPKRDHAIPPNPTPTLFAMCCPITHPPVRGIAAITLTDTRWQQCHLKATTLLANILLKQQAVDQGAAEAILIRDGHVTEGAASNLFAVIDGILITPPKSHEILPGITRDLLLELAEKHHIPAEETAISAEALSRASEIWLTSSTYEIRPVVELDGRSVGNGEIGPLWHRMNELYQAFKVSLRNP